MMRLKKEETLTNDFEVIITSNYKIDMRQWRVYLEEQWKDGKIKNWANARLLILGGVHGHKDGEVGDTDKRFVDA